MAEERSRALTPNVRRVLSRAYNNLESPASFSGEVRLLKAAKNINSSVKLKDVKSFLSEQNAHTLHKITRKKFRRRPILSPKPKVIVAIDLIDVRNLARENKGYKYIVVFIDTFSRFTTVKPIKKKDAVTLRDAIREAMNSDAFKGVSRLFVDKGGEFYNKKVMDYCRDKNIKVYSVSSYEIKASIAERVIQTLKRKMYKYFTANHTFRYITILPALVKSYNEAEHRTLGRSPKEAHSLTTPEEVTRQFYYIHKKNVRLKRPFSKLLTVGDNVRIATNKKANVFQKGYTLQNSEEIFVIDKIDRSQLPPLFYLRDLADEKIDGAFYKEELVPTTKPNEFPIRVLKRKNRKVMVHWIGYPKSFDSWIDEKDLQTLKK